MMLLSLMKSLPGGGDLVMSISGPSNNAGLLFISGLLQSIYISIRNLATLRIATQATIFFFNSAISFSRRSRSDSDSLLLSSAFARNWFNSL